MKSNDQEFEAFKRLPINFAAAALGYQVIKHKSSRQSAVLVGPGGHKIICSTSRHDGHGIFFSTDGQTSGSIIDLVQFLHKCNLGVARKILRPLLQPGGLPDDVKRAGEILTPRTTNFLSVLARFSNFDRITSPHRYLCETRKIPSDVLLSERFENRVFHDVNQGQVVFPHYGSPDGSKDRCLTGYVMKNDDFTMFSKGGKKGLWPSNAFPDDNKLVISEAGIDALSYVALNADIKHTRTVSTGGQLNPEQSTLIQSAIERLPSGEVIAAVDNDTGGERLAARLTRIFNESDRSDLTFHIDAPSSTGDDWNDVLRREL